MKKFDGYGRIADYCTVTFSNGGTFSVYRNTYAFECAYWHGSDEQPHDDMWEVPYRDGESLETVVRRIVRSRKAVTMQRDGVSAELYELLM